MPLDETSGNARPTTTRRDTSGSHERGHSANRDSTASRRVPSDAWNVMSDSEGTKQRRQSLKATNAGASRKRSRNTLREKKIDKPVEYVDDSAWIHRDKLAQIEIMEMEEAGIPIRQSRRSVSTGAGAERRRSRSQSRSRKGAPKEQEQEQMPAESYGTAYGGDEEYDRRRMSAIPAADEEDHQYDPNVDFEFRTPEEVAAEHEPRQSVRPSTSRIPVSKASPVPVPSTVVGRDSPLPRSRHGSTSGTWDEMQYQRKARSGSIGSQAILDDEDGVKTPPRPGSSQLRSSDGNSPPKSRLPTKAAPIGRKTSTPSSNGTERPGSSQGKQARAAPNTNKDRITSNGHRSRPSTSHAYNPEGDPPWISSMYKPDPRLPPDQQMLPTHAKRMMQEQWEREGISGTTYDRDLRLISDEPLPSPTDKSKGQPPPPLSLNRTRFEPEKAPSPSRTPKLEAPAKSPTSPNTTNMNAWPLTPESEWKAGSNSPRPGTSGGYKITPTIQSPPQIQRPEPSPARQTSPVRRMQDLDEKQEAQQKKGGCACCVMM
jgi:hypothetical protein